MVFLLSFYYCFPVERVINYFVSSFIVQNNIPLTVDNFHKTAGRIFCENITLKPNINIGGVSCKYGIKQIILKKTKCNFNGNVSGELDLSLPESKFNLVVNFDRLFENSEINGVSKVTGYIKKDDKEIFITSLIDKLIININFTPLMLQNISVKAKLKSDILTIENIKSEGNTRIFLKGQIIINYSKFEYSKINLTGKFISGKITKKISIVGNFKNCKLVF